MNELLAKLEICFPDLRYVSGKQFTWSPETGEIIYKANSKSRQDSWSLLHETGHALLGHTGYQSDVELLYIEVAAWEKARELAKEFNIKINEEHIQNCLDTYRDWLYKRSICPRCTAKCLQRDDGQHYRCFNCGTAWRVSQNRFCRTYRKQTQTKISAEAEIL